VQREFANTLAGLDMSPAELEEHIDQQQRRERELAADLEKRDNELVARTRELQTLLDHVSFGLLAIDRNLVILPGCSQSCHRLLDSEAIVGGHLGDILRLGPRLRAQYEQSVRNIFDGAPEQAALAEIPKRFQSVSGRALCVEPRVVRNERGLPVQLLMTISDVSELEQANLTTEMSRAMLLISRHRAAFETFLEQAREQLRVARKRAATDAGLVRRVIHGIKSTATVYGLDGIARMIGELEAQEQIDAADLDGIGDALKEFVNTHGPGLGVSFDKKSLPSLTLDHERFEQLRAVLGSAAATGDRSLDELVRELDAVPARDMLGPVHELVAALGTRFGKRVALDLRGGDLRLERSRLAPLVQVVPQLLRNAVDHGFEAPDARGTKPDVGRLILEIAQTDTTIVVAVQDDGRGIDRVAVLRAAVARGVVTEATARLINEADALKLVLRERVSTAATVTDVSGRGYGLSGVLSEAKRLGGDVVIHSRVGRGTRIELTVPKAGRPSRRPSQPPARSDTSQSRAPSQRA
jgi:chemotaxis protein histidine kinase CheA